MARNTRHCFASDMYLSVDWVAFDMSATMPCSNTHYLDDEEARMDALDQIQAIRDTRAQEIYETFDEDYHYFLRELTPMDMENLLIEIFEQMRGEGSQSDRFAMITDETDAKKKAVAKRMADCELTRGD